MHPMCRSVLASFAAIAGAGTALLAGGPAARADPWADPSTRLVLRAERLAGADVFLGAPDRSELSLATGLATVWTLGEEPSVAGSPAWVLARELAPELGALGGASVGPLPWGWAPSVGLAAGGLVPDYRAGDTESGDVSLRLGARARAYPWRLEAVAEVETGLDVTGSSVEPGLWPREAWLGLRWSFLQAGFGLRDRWLGPARHGALVLTDNARPAPLGTLALSSPRVPYLGRFHFEVGEGWLNGDRSDVTRPGWALWDLRWLPVPQVEIGASRTTLFGGVGRPPPEIGQLILPTDPHVSDDPDQILPDQDEIAALDFRVTLPVGSWTGRGSSGGPLGTARLDGIDLVELWWQYGGEDMIVRRNLGVPMPSLAGVANVFGGAVVAGPLSLTVEHARILDDTFRWYTGHRVYHQGFTRDGLPMGHVAGGDSLDWWGAVAWEPGAWGAELWAERRLRVGVIEASGDNLLALATDERTDRLGLRGWHLAETSGWWTAEVSGERVTGSDFVPGGDGWAVRVAVGR